MPRGKAPCRRHVYRRWCGAETIPRKMGMPIQAATILGFGSPHMCNHGVKLTKSFKVIPTPRLQCKSFPYLITHLYLAATEVTSMYSISAYSKSSCPQGGFALSAVEKSERERERESITSESFWGCAADAAGFDNCGGGLRWWWWWSRVHRASFWRVKGLKVPYLFATRFSYW